MEVKQKPEEVSDNFNGLHKIFLPVKIEPNCESEFSEDIKEKVEVDNDKIKNVKIEPKVQVDTRIIKSEHKVGILTPTVSTKIGQKQLNTIRGKPRFRKSSKNIANELAKQTNRRNFCPVCHKKLKSTLVARKHLDHHFGKCLAGCSSCGKFFKTKKEFFIHFHTHYISKQKIKTRKLTTKVSTKAAPNIDPIQVDPIFNCIHCSTVFFTKESLDTHMTSHYHVNNVGYNSFVQEYFDTFSVFASFPPKRKNGNKTSTGVKVELDIVGTSKETSSTTKVDVSNTNQKASTPKLDKVDTIHKTPISSLNCEICYKTCFSKPSLIKHREEHTRIKCILCAKVFASADFKSHLKEHSSKEPYDCKICSQNFRRAATLQQHLYLHQTEKKELLKCQICSTEFEKYGGFITHFKKFHAELKGTAFSEPLIITNVPVIVEDKSIEEEEEKEEMEDGPYKCDLCPKTFDVEKRYRQHISSHTFCKLCIVCSEPCYSRHLLRKHLSTHTKKKPFICPVCTESFGRAQSFEKHLVLEQRQDREDIVMKCTICDWPVHFFSKSQLNSHCKDNHVPNFDPVEYTTEVILKEEFNDVKDKLYSIKKELGDVNNEFINTELDIKEETDIDQDFNIKQECEEAETVSI